MKLSTAFAFGALFDVASALQVKQVSFDDPLANPGGIDNVDSRDAKINEGGENGSECFVYTSEANNNDDRPDLSFDDSKIWETCGVFGDGPLTNELLQGDTNGTEIDYSFPDTSGDGSKVCYIEDRVSVHLLSRSGSSVTEVTDSEASGNVRKSKRCDLSRDGTALVFDSDDNTLLPDDTQDNQEHVFYTDDEGATFHRLVPDEYYNGVDCSRGTCESAWGALSGDGSMAAFHSNIRYQDGLPSASSPTAWETYLWRKSDKSIHKITNFNGKECNRTAMFERLVDIYGLQNLTAQNLADESKLGNAQTQCESFAVAGMLLESGAGAIDVKDNPAGVSDDGRFVTFMASFESATARGTLEPATPVSRRNTFLYDSKLGITWAITREYQSQTPFRNEGPVDVEAFCCPTASESLKRGNCSIRNEMRQGCCWQKPCYNPTVTNRLSGSGDFIVFATDMAPGDTTQVNMDWEITHFHIPSGKTTLITDTNDKNYDDFFPSISRNGDVVAFTSDFDYTQNEPITANNQIFAAKISTGCSRDSTASNYHPSPDVEVCCEWDRVPEASGRRYLEANVSLHGDPSKMKSHVAFFDEVSGGEAWCTAYAEQVRNDVACSLAVPKEYVVVKADLDCGLWQEDEINVALILKENPVYTISHTCNRLQMQYENMDSALWKSYLTKTMKMDMGQLCTARNSKSSKR